MGESISRRDALLTMTGFATMAALAVGGGFALRKDAYDAVDKPVSSLPDFSVKTEKPCDIAIIKGTDRKGLVDKAFAALGGVDRYIKAGDKVLVKPNIAWARSPEQAANTHPDVVEETVRLCLEAGAKRVVVADNTCHNTESAYSKSGIKEAVQKAGGTLVTVSDADFILLSAPGEKIDGWPFMRLLFESDKVINMPVVKHHSLCQATIGLKNLMGVIGGDRGLFHQDIHHLVATLGKFVPCTLTLIDATRILLKNGPVGGNMMDVLVLDTIALGTDPVALDAWGCTLLGIDPGTVKYLDLAERYGVGTRDFKSLKITEASI
jgi:uncharacterized protein (DUF362 family)